MQKKIDNLENSIFLKIFLFLFYTLIFFILLNNSFSSLDPDFGWHLKVGEQILNQKKVPSFQVYDYTLGDAKWVDHEWLFNLFIFIVYSKLGYVAVNIFFALLVLGIIALLNKFIFNNFLKKKNRYFLYVFEILGIFTMLPTLGVRMQEISILFLLIELILIESYSKTKNIKILFFFIPLFLVWVNLHAGFILGTFIYFSWLALKILERLFSKTKLMKRIEYKIFSNKDLLIYFMFGLSIIITTFFNPYFFNLHKYLSVVFQNNSYMLLINEWLPIYYLPIVNVQLIYAGIIATVLILSTYYAFLKRKQRKINLWYYLLAVLFLILAFKSKRHFPLFFITTIPFLMMFLSKEIVGNFNFVTRASDVLFVRTIFILSTILCIIAILISTNFTQKPFSNKKFCAYYPCEAVDFLKNNKEYRDLKIYNNYGDGGFFIWKWPEKKLFADGRFPQYAYAGHTILEEFLEFENKEKTQSKLDEYDIEVVLLKNPRTINVDWVERIFLGVKNKTITIDSALFDYLDSSDEWENVFNDENNSIYVKK